MWKDSLSLRPYVNIGDWPGTVLDNEKAYWKQFRVYSDAWDEFHAKFVELTNQVQYWQQGETDFPRYMPPDSIIPVIETMLKLAKKRNL